MPSERRTTGELLAASGAFAGDHDDLVECLEHSAVGIHVVDRTGMIVWVNPALCAALGRDADDCVGRHAAELHADAHVFTDMWSQLRAGEPVPARAARLRGAAGACDVVLSASPGHDPHGALVGARFCARGPATPTGIAALVAEAPLGIVRARLDGTILAVNPAVCDLLARPAAELVGCDLFALTHPDDRQLDQDKFAQLCAAQIRSYVLTRRMLRGDGSLVWTRLHAAVARDGGGEPQFWFGLVEDIDARHRAEEDRRRHERQYEILTRLSPVGIFLGAAEAECVFVNAEWSRITGRTLPEVRGGAWRRALHPDDAARVIAGCRRAFAEGQPFSGEWRMLRPDGTTVWVLGQFAEVPDGSAHKHYVGTITDITDRVRAELDRARLAVIVENAADALFLLNHDGTVAIWNPGAEKLLGHTGAEIRGRFIGDLVPGHGSEVQAAMRRVLAGDVVREIEAQVRRDDGSLIGVTVTACPVHDGEGHVSAISVILHDVTELKEIEQALRTSEARFRALVEVSTQIVWTTDPTGAAVEDSPGWRAFTGQTYEELRGWGWVNAIASEDRARVIAEWKAACAGREPFRSEYRLRRADGSYAVTEVRAVPMLGPGGVVREWVGASVDVSDQRRVAEQREALVADLRRAMHYQEMFMAVLGHDLRSPLSAILMATSLGLRRRPDDRMRRVLQQIASSGQRMLRMIEQLLDVTRIRAAGGLEVRPTRADLAAICRTIIDEQHQANPAARIVLDARGETVGTWDVDRLSQMASNLIGNAIQHAEGAPVATAQVDGRDPALVRFIVHNRGVIAPEMLGAIFDPFQRAAKDSTKTAGLGLGLYITEQIALAHGGSVAVESTRTGGTYFRVELPRHPKPATLSPPGARDEEGVPLLRGDVVG
ncbi:PAS domain S-box protein [Nannocystis sp. SCPEA4]|uniref:PAS domain-containing sensor histidine kinase n=1 Tax=Nannocystis sp. SCPEA4 TaxID=2996787 RepID=UPI00226F96E7|nr:PAS domain S-box protein [Nannocystis sp. SCPEA4]MCY1061816.1 PAS domain S-box protein [Nannocystis sp. SCPEA4]